MSDFMNNNGSAGQTPLSIVVLGASGDLSRKKIFPALFALDSRGLLPPGTRVFGLARSRFSHAEFRREIAANLTCRYTPRESCAEKTEAFLDRCFYLPAAYDSPDSFLELHRLMRGQGEPDNANRLFYFALPPFLFQPAANAMGASGLVQCSDSRALPSGWTRVVVEKPFGRDRVSAGALHEAMGSIFSEPQIFRIDHYLGKEMIQNLLTLRFANRVFEPLWGREHVESVRISFRENIGVPGRGGYFDQYGIVRDILQNHLTQMLALTAMERPACWAPECVRSEKVRLLRAVRPLCPEEMALGQYGETSAAGIRLPGYQEEAAAPGSRTPTHAAAVLHVDNERWRGVPFLLEAGKALDNRLTEIRIHFRAVPEGFYPASCLMTRNELVVRVQPDEAVLLRILNKAPSLRMRVAETELNLRYETAFGGEPLPDAYESLLLDAIAGDKTFFLAQEEIEAAWDIFTPALHAAEESGLVPEIYPRGTAGPAGALKLLAREQ